MQHYGVKTRFLDWSYSFQVALFFATYTENARLWILDPHLLNEVFYGKYTVIKPNAKRPILTF